jgi:hypothetical protein
MTRRLRSLNRGRLAVWWVTHRQDAIRSMQLVLLVALFLAASTADYHDQLDQERAARAAVEERLADARELHGPIAPPTVFVIEARTTRDLEARLEDILGSLYAARSNAIARRP